MQGQKPCIYALRGMGLLQMQGIASNSPIPFGIRQLPILPCPVSKLNASVELYRFCLRSKLLRQNYRSRH